AGAPLRAGRRPGLPARPRRSATRRSLVVMAEGAVRPWQRQPHLDIRGLYALTYAVGAALAGEHRAGAPEHEPADYDRALGAGEQVAHHDGGVPRRAHTRLRPGPDELEARHGPAPPPRQGGPPARPPTRAGEGGGHA